jgi:hypothetical protein
MVTKEEIMELVRVSLIGPILQYAESSLPEGQFRAYRRLVLDQFGGKGFGRELDKLFLNRKQPER